MYYVIQSNLLRHVVSVLRHNYVHILTPSDCILQIKKVRQEPPGLSPLNVIVHFLLTADDTNNLITWQEAQIQKGNLKQDDPCAPKMIVMYKCCTRTVIPFIGPEFGSLMIGTD